MITFPLSTVGLGLTLTLSLLLPAAANGNIDRRQSVPSVLPGNWTSEGCYTDISTARTLSADSFINTTSMTVESCIAFCTTAGYVYAGVEFGQECYCDAVIQDTGTPTTLDACNTPCTGNMSETCGSANHLNVFYSGGPLPSVIQSIGETGWTYQGCYTDTPSQRTLRVGINIPEGVTAESCTAACQSAGNYLNAGMEDGHECWCDDFISASAQVVSDTNCQTVCSANHHEYCGSPNHLSLYHFSPPDNSSAPQACVSSNIANFTLVATYKDPPTSGPATVNLKITLVELVPDVVWTILSACSTCCSQWPFYSLQNSIFLPHSPFDPTLQMVSTTPQVGESPNFVAVNPPFPGDQGYCSTVDPVRGPGSPPLLAFQGISDDWALCSNITANGRLDVVFSPIANHPHYTLTSCSPITIQMIGA